MPRIVLEDVTNWDEVQGAMNAMTQELYESDEAVKGPGWADETIMGAYAAIAAIEGGNTSVVYASNYGVSGSILETTCSFTSGSKVVTLANAQDFAIGDGVAIEGAGTTGVLDGWLVTKIDNIVGTTVTIHDNALATSTAKKFMHDDSVALQAAINYATSILLNTRDRVLVIDAPNLYVMNIELPSYLRITGAKPILYAPLYATNPNHIYSPDYNMFYASGKKNIYFDNLVFDQGKTRGVEGDIYNGILSVRSIDNEYVTYKGCTFQNGYYVATRNYGSQKNIAFIENLFDNVDTCMHFYGYLELDGLTIENNIVTGGTSECIAIISGTGESTYAKNIRIRFNDFSGKTNSTAIFYGAKTSNIEISHNKFSDGMSGITCCDTLIEEETIISNNIHMHHNNFDTMTGTGISVTGYNITVEDNICKNCGSDGIQIGTAIVSENVTIRNNLTDECGTTSGYCGIRLRNILNGDCYGNTVKRATDFYMGIKLDGNLSNVKIHGNKPGYNAATGTHYHMNIMIGTNLTTFRDIEIYDNIYSGGDLAGVDLAILATKSVKLWGNRTTAGELTWNNKTVAANGTCDATIFSTSPFRLTTGTGTILQTLYTGFDGEEVTIRSVADTLTIGVTGNIVLVGGVQKNLKIAGELTLRYIAAKSKWYEVNWIDQSGGGTGNSLTDQNLTTGVGQVKVGTYTEAENTALATKPVDTLRFVKKTIGAQIVPSDGLKGQSLIKKSDAPYDSEWVDVYGSLIGTVAHSSYIFTLDLLNRLIANFKITSADTTTKSIVLSNVPNNAGTIITVTVLFICTTSCIITHPTGTTFAYGLPTFITGQSYWITYDSIDGGTTWAGYSVRRT